MIAMRKIGVIGDGDSVLCFKAFGLSVFCANENNPEENRKIVDHWARDNYGVIFITEQIAQGIESTIDRYNKQQFPAIILIPASTGSLGIGKQRIRDNVEKAVGINIL